MTNYFLKFILLAGMLLTGFPGHAQTPTVGLLFFEPETSDGYTLFTPEGNQSVYLINNCGEKINEWTFSETPGLTCYLLDNGTLLRAGKDSIEIRDWNNNLLWSYATMANGIRQHHDIHPLPNGNILCVCRDLYTPAEIIAEGRDPALVVGDVALEKIVELSPAGEHDADIVWEWKFIDHLIQDFDNTKLNFGNVKDHPELLDLNFHNNNNFDYIHLNAVAYNPALDQIIITARHLSELYIIDHSTTILEAAGHSGGNSGMGGDFLWRWGNPQVYREGGDPDQKLFLPHNGKWVDPGYLDEGKISVFNNGGDGSSTFSSVHLITPVIENGIYLKENNQFVPLDFEWTWSGSILGEVVDEINKSGAHSLPNGNFIICQTSLGQVSEIMKNGTHLWTYMNPSGDIIYNQYESIPPLKNSIFRAEKYPVIFPGFAGQDMTPQGLIEDQNPVSDSCITITGIGVAEEVAVSIINPVERGKIQFNQNIRVNAIEITDINGKLVYKQGFFHGNAFQIDLIPAMYILQLHFDNKMEIRKIIVF